MPKKIGEVLKEAGLVTSAQLDEALKAQLFNGGHLGTCLMELGMIDEDTLGEALSKAFRVPYAPPKVLQNLSSKTIKALPRRLAEKYRAIPISVDEGGIHVSLIDPRNVQTLDEIAFVTGHRVIAWVSPEARISQALDRYYGVRRSSRYINLCRSLEATRTALEATIMQASGEPRGAASFRRAAEIREPDPAAPEPSTEQGGEYGYGRCWQEIAADIGLDRTHPEGAGAEEASAVRTFQPPSDGAVRPTIWESTDKLCRAEKKQDAVEAVLEFTSARMARSIFLGVDDDVASVWDSRGTDIDRRRKSQAVFPVGSERLFELLLGDDYYRGPLTSMSLFMNFYSALGMDAPREILLVPIHFDDHLVAVFYGDGGRSGSVTGETEEYLRLFRMFPLAVNQIVIKDSMRAIGYRFSEAEPRRSLTGTP